MPMVSASLLAIGGQLSWVIGYFMCAIAVAAVLSAKETSARFVPPRPRGTEPIGESAA